ncbi:hypothetical protein HDE_06489 [Halotydeus destructor]|nr:hypothetical protein HDE_06489 [Halotydeus destructor]
MYFPEHEDYEAYVINSTMKYMRERGDLRMVPLLRELKENHNENRGLRKVLEKLEANNLERDKATTVKCQSLKASLVNAHAELSSCQAQVIHYQSQLADRLGAEGGEKCSKKSSKRMSSKAVVPKLIQQRCPASFLHFCAQEKEYEKHVAELETEAVELEQRYAEAEAVIENQTVTRGFYKCCQTIDREAISGIHVKGCSLHLEFMKLITSRKTGLEQIGRSEKDIRTLMETVRSLKDSLSAPRCLESSSDLKNQKLNLAKDKELADSEILKLREINASLIVEKKELQARQAELSKSRSELLNSKKLVAKLDSQISNIHLVKMARYEEAMKSLERCVGKLKAQHADEIDSQVSQMAAQINKIKGLEMKRMSDISETEFKALTHEVSECKCELNQTFEANELLERKISQVEEDVREVMSSNFKIQASLKFAQVNEIICRKCNLTLVDLEDKASGMIALASCGHVMCCGCFESHTRIRSACPICQTEFLNHQGIKLFL